MRNKFNLLSSSIILNRSRLNLPSLEIRLCYKAMCYHRCVTKLCVTKLCVTKLCVTIALLQYEVLQSYVLRLCYQVTQPYYYKYGCVTKLCVTKLCVTIALLQYEQLVYSTKSCEEYFLILLMHNFQIITWSQDCFELSNFSSVSIRSTCLSSMNSV